MNDKLKKLTLFSAINFVIANMVGTGVFTSLGFQLIDIKNPAALLILWAIGGVMALFGSFVYGELGAAMPRSGGEYNFLSKIYNPFLGFLAGWVSITIGFAAPVAAACIAFGKYYNMAIDKISAMADVSWLQATPMVAGLIVLVLPVHSTSVRAAGAFKCFHSLKIIVYSDFYNCWYILCPKTKYF